MPNSLTHEDSEGMNGDVTHEVGSASSTSTTSSMFSGNHRDPNILYQNGPHTSTSLTPLTNIDSSPRAGTMTSPPKKGAYDNTSANFPRSPLSSNHDETCDLYGSSTDAGISLVESRARPKRGEVKGFKAVYDPDLDKTLKGKEKRSRQVQFQPFGEEVSRDLR